MSSLAAVNATPELATLPPVSRAIVAIAYDEGRPLRPVTLETDREVLLRAEHLVRRERLLGREALARARDEEIDVATVRGIYRFARALLENDDVVAFEDGAVRELSRRELVDEAFRLFALPPALPVEITVEDVPAAFPGSVEITGGAVELAALGDPLGEEFGPIVGLCAHCGDAVRAGAEGELMLAVFTFTNRALSKRAWRFVAPSDVTAKTGKPSKLASLLLEAEEPVLCHACATRLSAGLLSQTPDAPELVVTPEPAGGGGPYFAPRLDRKRSELQLEQIAPTLYLTRGGIIVKPRPRTPDVEDELAVDPGADEHVLEPSTAGGVGELRRALLERARETERPLDVDDPRDEAVLHRATLLAIAHPLEEALGRARAATYLPCPTCGKLKPLSLALDGLRFLACGHAPVLVLEDDRAVDDHVGADVLEHDEVVATPGAGRYEPELEQRELAEIDRHDRQDVQELETTIAALAHEGRIEAGMSIDAFLGVRR